MSRRRSSVLRRARGGSRLAAIALVVACATAAVPAATAAPLAGATAVDAGATTSATTSVPRMFAYYYLWWSESHWASRLGPSYPIAANPQPLPATLGADGCGAVPLYAGTTLFDVDQFPRGQDTPGVIEQDVRDAARAGLKGFIANWSGTGLATQAIADSPYSTRLAELVRSINKVRSEGIDFSLWISYKGSASLRTPSQINGDLAFLKRTWGMSAAFDRSYWRPIVVLTGSRKYATADLKLVSDANRASFYLVGDETSATWTPDRAALLDGDHYYWSSQNPYTNPGSFTQLQSLATKVRASGPNPNGGPKRWFAPLAPGYNSTLIGGTTCVPRNDGETLRTLFAGNAQSKPDAWVLISWNEIAEGTHVQPLTRWGTRYTDVLRTLLLA